MSEHKATYNIDKLKQAGILDSNGCLTVNALLRFAHNEMKPENRLMVDQHISGCAMCRDAIEGIALMPSRDSAREAIDNINRHVTHKKEKKPVFFLQSRNMAAAAVLLVLFSATAWLLVHNIRLSGTQENKIAEAPAEPAPQSAYEGLASGQSGYYSQMDADEAEASADHLPGLATPDSTLGVGMASPNKQFDISGGVAVVSETKMNELEEEKSEPLGKNEYKTPGGEVKTKLSGDLANKQMIAANDGAQRDDDMLDQEPVELDLAMEEAAPEAVSEKAEAEMPPIDQAKETLAEKPTVKWQPMRQSADKKREADTDRPARTTSNTITPTSMFATGAKNDRSETKVSGITRQAQFPGGEAALWQWISSRLQYPKQAQEQEIEGTVTVSFTINKKGKVTKVTVTDGVQKDLDKEAVRLVKSLPDWSPALENGIPHTVSRQLPIKFSLPK